MFAVERRQLIVKEARDNGRIDVAEAASTLGVSTETIRRDLTILEQQSLLRRVHGGAVPVDSASVVPTLSERSDIMAGAKRAIGRAATAYLPPRGAILLDAGTTTAQLAAAIPPDRELIVVTNALPTAEALVQQPLLTVHLLGGRLRASTLATVDYQALEQLASIDVNVAFMAAYGVSLTRGFSTPDPFEAAVKQAMMRSARKVVMLADSSKLDHAYMSVFASLQEVDVLITDRGASPDQLTSLGDRGLKVELSNGAG